MSFARYFKLSSYCLIASGFVAIAATGALDLFALVLFAAALISSWFIDTARVYRRLSGWPLNLLSLAYFPAYLIDYEFLSRSFITSTVRLFFYVAALKLLTLARDRDYVYLYVISFAELLAASTLTIDVVFAACLFVFLVSGVSSLMLFEMRRSNAIAMEKGRLQPPVVPSGLEGSGLELFSRFPAGKVACVTLAATLMILLISIPLFFLLPRASFGVLPRPSGPTQFVSGFTDRVELGQIGLIKQSDAVVMRVKVNEPPSELPADTKWRGIALDHYDGRVWSRTDLRLNPVNLRQGAYFKLEEFSDSRELLAQTFFLEALSTSVVFTSRKVLAVSRDIGLIQRDASGSLFTLDHASRKIRYVAISDPSRPEPSLLNTRSGTIPEEVRNTCLQLPRQDPRIGRLAREITGDRATPFEKARALETYLLKNYSYSLEMRGSPNTSDPLAAFLFDVRRGHCEYFASAMVIMLREVGIPARLVNGFRRGEYNKLGDDWTVRQYDAHSWVEAYFPPFGWYDFDPTPPDPQHFRPALAKVFADIVDAVDLWWWDDVVSYDIWRQFQLIGTLRANIGQCQQYFKDLAAGAWSSGRLAFGKARESGWLLTPGPLIFAAAALLVIAALQVLRPRNGPASRLARAIHRLVSRPAGPAVVVGFYADAVDFLRSQGLQRSRGQTPLEFARSLGSHPGAGPFEALTRLYNRARFGTIEDAIATSQAEGLLKSLRDSTRG